MVVFKPLPFALHMCSGDHDRVTASAPLLLAKLKLNGAHCVYRQDAGAHSWNYWRRHTADMLRTVSEHFRAGKTPQPPLSKDPS